MTTSNSRLTPKIGRLLAWCFEHAPRRRKEPLAGGLSITVYIDLAGDRHVCLARKGTVGPSLQEARTVLAHWPEPVPAYVKWKAAQIGQFAVLVSIWTPPAPAKQLRLENSQ